MSLQRQILEAIEKIKESILNLLLRFSLRSNWHKTSWSLIKIGANVNHKFSNGDTLLHISINDRNLMNVRFLIAVGADVNVRNQKNYTPIEIELGNLEHLKNYNDLRIIEALIDAGANPREIACEAIRLKTETSLPDLPIFFYIIFIKIESILELFLNKDPTLVDLVLPAITALNFDLYEQDDQIDFIEPKDELEIEALGGDPGDYDSYLNPIGYISYLRFNKNDWDLNLADYSDKASLVDQNDYIIRTTKLKATRW